MEYVFGSVLEEYLFHVPAVGDAGDYGRVGNVRVLLCHHQPDVVHWSFGLVYEHHFCRLVFCNLAHEL